MSHATWTAHVLGHHAEMAQYHQFVAPTVMAPELVVEDPTTHAYRYYRRSFPMLRLQRNWIQVIVDWADGRLIVKSAWMVRSVKKGIPRWP